MVPGVKALWAPEWLVNTSVSVCVTNTNGGVGCSPTASLDPVQSNTFRVCWLTRSGVWRWWIWSKHMIVLFNRRPLYNESASCWRYYKISGKSNIIYRTESLGLCNTPWTVGILLHWLDWMILIWTQVAGEVDDNNDQQTDVLSAGETENSPHISCWSPDNRAWSRHRPSALSSPIRRSSAAGGLLPQPRTHTGGDGTSVAFCCSFLLCVTEIGLQKLSQLHQLVPTRRCHHGRC